MYKHYSISASPVLQALVNCVCLVTVSARVEIKRLCHSVMHKFKTKSFQFPHERGIGFEVT